MVNPAQYFMWFFGKWRQVPQVIYDCWPFDCAGFYTKDCGTYIYQGNRARKGQELAVLFRQK